MPTHGGPSHVRNKTVDLHKPQTDVHIRMVAIVAAQYGNFIEPNKSLLEKKHKNTNSKKHMVKICENQHFFKICIPKKKFTADPAICEGLTYTKSTYQLCKTCLN